MQALSLRDPPPSLLRGERKEGDARYTGRPSSISKPSSRLPELLRTTKPFPATISLGASTWLAASLQLDWHVTNEVVRPVIWTMPDPDTGSIISPM